MRLSRSAKRRMRPAGRPSAPMRKQGSPAADGPRGASPDVTLVVRWGISRATNMIAPLTVTPDGHRPVPRSARCTALDRACDTACAHHGRPVAKSAKKTPPTDGNLHNHEYTSTQGRGDPRALVCRGAAENRGQDAASAHLFASRIRPVHRMVGGDQARHGTKTKPGPTPGSNRPRPYIQPKRRGPYIKQPGITCVFAGPRLT
ncbi:hypothetical protein ATI53_107911 [Salipiger aestuarii]|uniref:Uncharacterized protein n=1 Tax=Salipiger aestuarii TaxID=568098 RepID=A0A327XMU2_9RHOB|nr:hypothetical protein ATI53_107911 [Salipiger aestuarii]